jgi:hypothetical protein
MARIAQQHGVSLAAVDDAATVVLPTDDAPLQLKKEMPSDEEYLMTETATNLCTKPRNKKNKASTVTEDTANMNDKVEMQKSYHPPSSECKNKNGSSSRKGSEKSDHGGSEETGGCSTRKPRKGTPVKFCPVAESESLAKNNMDRKDEDSMSRSSSQEDLNADSKLDDEEAIKKMKVPIKPLHKEKEASSHSRKSSAPTRISETPLNNTGFDSGDDEQLAASPDRVLPQTQILLLHGKEFQIVHVGNGRWVTRNEYELMCGLTALEKNNIENGQNKDIVCRKLDFVKSPQKQKTSRSPSPLLKEDGEEQKRESVKMDQLRDTTTSPTSPPQDESTATATQGRVDKQNNSLVEKQISHKAVTKLLANKLSEKAASNASSPVQYDSPMPLVTSNNSRKRNAQVESQCADHENGDEKKLKKNVETEEADLSQDSAEVNGNCSENSKGSVDFSEEKPSEIKIINSRGKDENENGCSPKQDFSHLKDMFTTSNLTTEAMQC